MNEVVQVRQELLHGERDRGGRDLEDGTGAIGESPQHSLQAKWSTLIASMDVAPSWCSDTVLLRVYVPSACRLFTILGHQRYRMLANTSLTWARDSETRDLFDLSIARRVSKTLGSDRACCPCSGSAEFNRAATHLRSVKRRAEPADERSSLHYYNSSTS